MTSTPELMAPKFKWPYKKNSTSDSDENEPPAIRRKPIKNPRKNEARVAKTTTSKQTFQPPSIEYATTRKRHEEAAVQLAPRSPSSKSTNALSQSYDADFDIIEQNFDLQLIKKRHDEIHAAAVLQAQKDVAIELAKPIDPNTSFGTSLSSIESRGSAKSGNVEYSAETHASNQREQILSPPGQIDHGNVEKETNQPEVPAEAEDQRYRVISVDDYLSENVEEQTKQTVAPAEVEYHRKRTISVEDCEIDIEITRISNARGQQKIETVDLSIDNENEEEYENNVVHENVPAKSLRSAAAKEEPQQIDDNERSLVVMTKKPGHSFRWHRYKKTPRRMKAVEEIKRLQKSVDLLIPKRPFQRVVREIMIDQLSSDFNVQGNALAALHEAAEKFLIELFEQTVLLCSHRDRVTIALKDIRLACNLQERYELNHRCG